ncbi:hypothetical protein EDD85DRAFT_4539 [Armillaria nabsnona]|nr:hypothetical protein EDD85DRAFT_4539 [Armillaria nabsnona]
MDTVQRSPTMADLNMAVVISLSGRVALVTGRGIGIGFNTAKTFAANGAKVYITGRRLDVLEKAAASVTGVPGSMIPLQMDVTDEEAVEAGAKHIENIDGQLDVSSLTSSSIVAPVPLPCTNVSIVLDSPDPFTTQTSSRRNSHPCVPTSSNQRSRFTPPRHVKCHQHQQHCGIT